MGGNKTINFSSTCTWGEGVGDACHGVGEAGLKRDGHDGGKHVNLVDIWGEVFWAMEHELQRPCG